MFYAGLLAALLLPLTSTPIRSAESGRASGNLKTDTIAVFDFKQAPLADVLKVFTGLTGKNVVATPEIQTLGISLYLEKVSAMVALETLCKNYNLWYAQEGNVIRVMKVEEYGRELVLRRDEKIRIFNLRYASCLAVADMAARIYGERVDYEAPEDMESYGHIGTDEYPEIGEEMDIEGDEENDSDRNRSKRRRTNEKIIEAGGVEMEQQDMARLRQLLAAGGAVSAESLLGYQVGQATARLTVFPRNNTVLVRSVDARLLDDIGELVRQVDTPTRQVLLEVKILEITLGDGFDSFFDLSLTPGGTVDATSDAAVNNVVRDDSGVSMDLVNASSLAEASLSFLFIDKNIQAQIEMLEQTGRVRRISTPLMLCANNASAKFFQGVESPVRSGYTVTEEQRDDENNVTSPASVSTDYEEEELGVTLEVSPLINEDRTITLKIKSEVSTLNLGGGPDFNYTVNGTSQIGETDSVNKTEIEDIIVAMDGQTLALGGLVEEEEVENISKVPLLGDIPLLGLLFRSESTSKEQTEIVFCITPHIMMSPAENGDISTRVLRDVSEHPYYRNGRKRLLRYDTDNDTLELRSTDQETP
jgi:type II secretory pathway component GspD/PulD (secretin)